LTPSPNRGPGFCGNCFPRSRPRRSPPGALLLKGSRRPAAARRRGVCPAEAARGPPPGAARGPPPGAARRRPAAGGVPAGPFRGRRPARGLCPPGPAARGRRPGHTFPLCSGEVARRTLSRFALKKCVFCDKAARRFRYGRGAVHLCGHTGETAPHSRVKFRQIPGRGYQPRQSKMGIKKAAPLKGGIRGTKYAIIS